MADEVALDLEELRHLQSIAKRPRVLSPISSQIDNLDKLKIKVHNHVNRSGNLVADALAKKAASIVGSHVWPDALPLDIAALVDFDVH
uniref:Uncharacterized protein n=1 Tax=Quercus lobata TaxID=97700 RepID=A0A7N2MRL8_QUELO